MNYQLPSKFKKIGLLIAPLGLTIWALLQKFGLPKTIKPNPQGNHLLMIILLSTSFILFILGFLFIIFSKEKIEDEFIKNKRLKSYQFAAATQISLIIILIPLIPILEKYKTTEFIYSLFLLIILISWVMFIIKFNFSNYFVNTKHD